VLAFPHVLDFLPDELTSLRAWRLTLLLIPLRSLYNGFFRHGLTIRIDGQRMNTGEVAINVPLGRCNVL
jgi:hypothetical protein